MVERLTDQARRSVIDAEAEARAMRNDWLGTEHLLLGLLHSPDDLPAKVLAQHEVSLDLVRGHVEQVIGEQHASPGGHIPFTPRVKTIMQIGAQEAEKLRHDHIGSGHLLLALIHEGQGIAPQVLCTLGADRHVLEKLLLQGLRDEHGDPAQRLRTRVIRLASAIALGVLAAAIARALRKSSSERTWTGTLGGVVPYDLRSPTPERLRSKYWAPEDPRILTPHGWGVGWAINLGRLVRLARRRR